MKLHIGGVSLFLALSGLPLGIANALDTGVQNLSISQQENTCKGVVKDSKGETIIGASVVVKGTSNGTITDFDGNFSLSNVKKRSYYSNFFCWIQITRNRMGWFSYFRCIKRRYRSTG